MATAFQPASDLVDDICSYSPVPSTQLGLPDPTTNGVTDSGSRGIERERELRSRYRPLLEPFLESDDAVEFMRVHGFRTPEPAHEEVLRHPGRPGQASSYKLGEREIHAIREEAKVRMGAAFDLRDIHSALIDCGAVRLDVLRDVVPERLAG